MSYLPVIEKWKLSKSSELHFISTLQVSLFFSTSNVKFQFNDLSEIFEDNCFRSELYIWQQAILLIDALGFEPDIQADVKDFSLIYSDSGNFQNKQLALSTTLQLHFSVFHSHDLLFFLLTFLVQICLAKTFFLFHPQTTDVMKFCHNKNKYPIIIQSCVSLGIWYLSLLWQKLITSWFQIFKNVPF